MDFFSAQDRARRNTWRLAGLFALALISLVVLTNLLIGVALVWFGMGTTVPTNTGANPVQNFNLSAVPPHLWVAISLGVVAVVAAGSIYKYAIVKAGGRAIAESLGGQKLLSNTQDPKERRLLNVVEEMAIASGVPVPPVYLIREPSINAFAAGFGQDDAVIGINQGTIDHLSRAELQGVVAHEFSHLLNGDTNINLKLIAILHGILFIGLIGYTLMRTGGYSRRDGLPLLVLGGGLAAIGFGGTFFGKLIKSAVSRQREYLADSSAVQYTRDPSGIANALKKIGGLSYQSHMPSAAAEEVSHMLFGTAQQHLSRLTSTHPPLDERIRAIEPNWDGKFTAAQANDAAIQAQQAGAELASQFAGSGFSGTDTSPASQSANAQQNAGPFSSEHLVVDVSPAHLANSVGESNVESRQVAKALIDGTHELLYDAAHDPFEARALLYAMLLSTRPDVLAKQQARLVEHAERGVPAHTAKLLPAVTQLDALAKLTLVEMAIPALTELSNNQYKRFSDNCVSLITVDAEIDLFEWVMHRLLVKDLKPHFEGPFRSPSRFRSVAKISGDAATLLSEIARHGHGANRDSAQAAFAAGSAALGLPLQYDDSADHNFQRLNEALGNLRMLTPLEKPKVLKAAAATALADGHVSSAQGALLQGISATLDCPLPPSIYGARGA